MQWCVYLIKLPYTDNEMPAIKLCNSNCFLAKWSNQSASSTCSNGKIWKNNQSSGTSDVLKD